MLWLRPSLWRAERNLWAAQRRCGGRTACGCMWTRTTRPRAHCMPLQGLRWPPRTAAGLACRAGSCCVKSCGRRARAAALSGALGAALRPGLQQALPLPAPSRRHTLWEERAPVRVAQSRQRRAQRLPVPRLGSVRLALRRRWQVAAATAGARTAQRRHPT